MKSQMLVVSENIDEFRTIQLQEQLSKRKQLQTLLQREIFKMKQDCERFEIQYRELALYSHHLSIIFKKIYHEN